MKSTKYSFTGNSTNAINGGAHKTLVFLTNNFELPALTIALLYKSRWKVEWFFKWIKHFYGEQALAANPASKQPEPSKLKRGAAARVHPIVGHFHVC